jgi:hypothetical protein
VANGEFPFDHPTLYSQRPSPNAVPIGQGLPGINGQVPQWIANSPPNVGNVGFKVGIRQALAGAEAVLNISSVPPVANVVHPDQTVGPIILDTTGAPPAGYGTAHWPIPADPALNGRVVYMQWVVQDPAAAGGQARSQPLMVTLFCGTMGCPRTCLANCDGSSVAPILNVNDFVCFQQQFAAADPRANCDASTVPPVLNVNDFVCFQQRFAAGCP